MTHLFFHKRIILLFLTAVFLLVDQSGWFHRLETWTYDWGMRLSHHPADKRVVLITVDKKSISALGNWPWDARIELLMLRTLSNHAPKLIADTRFPTIHNDPSALGTLIQVRKKFAGLNRLLPAGIASENSGFIRALADIDNLLSQGISYLDVEAEYGHAITRAGNVILALGGVAPQASDSLAPPPSTEVAKYSISANPDADAFL
ncbi:MAG: CHASE2 domain-containing protein, partial [Magnetococcales bacterium]|nr:CHASE2 domain-containing protein [Magnetococcales bacterium]